MKEDEYCLVKLHCDPPIHRMPVHEEAAILLALKRFMHLISGRDEG